MINLSSVIHSPYFAQTFSILRTSGTWDNGVFVKGTPTTVTFEGIITVASPKDLSIVAEADRRGGGMRILTTEPIYATGEESTSGFSDILLWNGKQWRIQSVTPDSDWGFYRGICTRLIGGFTP